MASKLTSTQVRTVERVTTDRIGERSTVTLEAWRKAFAFTAWELFKV
jgi:hypothetical protein